MAIPNQDIMLEIFFRLPTRAVGKFRCLSKTWNSQLSTKYLINSHLTQLKTHQEQEKKQKFVFINKKSGFLHMFTLPLKSIRKIDLGNKWSFVLGSCNGLVLLLDDKAENMFVLNPVTRKQVQLPFSHSEFVNTDFDQIYGFGYDSSGDDYKAVKLSYYSSPDEDGRHYFVDVYCLRTCVWRRVVNGKCPFDDHGIVCSYFVMPFVNGALHWAVKDSDSRYHIHAFDLASETFQEVQFPKEVEYGYICNLMVLKGCLSMLWCCDNVYRDLWIMKEYGVMDSCMMFRFDLVAMERLIPVCFVREEELLCVRFYNKDRWVSCDLREEMVEQIADGRIPFSIDGGTSCSVFVESLVSPEQRNVE